jgi:hypothetical protein
VSAVIGWSEATKQSNLLFRCTNGLLRFARNDGPTTELPWLFENRIRLSSSAKADDPPETLMVESRGRGVLDRPVKPGDDSSFSWSDLSAVAQRAKAEAAKQSILPFAMTLGCLKIDLLALISISSFRGSPQG